MFNLNNEQTAFITMKMDFENVDPKNLNYRFSIVHEGVTLSFAGKVDDKKEVTFTIPPIGDKIKTEDGEGLKCEGMVEVFQEGFYTSPWTGEVFIRSNPKIKLRENKQVHVLEMAEKSGETQSGSKEEDISDMVVEENANIKVTGANRTPEKRRGEKDTRFNLIEKLGGMPRSKNK